MERVFQSADGSAFLERGEFLMPDLLDRCIAEVVPKLEEQPEIVVYGKVCKQRRNIGFFSDESVGYNYSKRLMKSQPLTEAISEMLVLVNTQMNSNFNGILVNKYMNGSDYIGAHSDSELGLDDRVGVVAVSYGAERIFRIRDKITKKIVCDEITAHCSVMRMGGCFQKMYTHEIPVQKKIKEPRVSFTFRKHIK